MCACACEMQIRGDVKRERDRRREQGEAEVECDYEVRPRPRVDEQRDARHFASTRDAEAATEFAARWGSVQKLHSIS